MIFSIAETTGPLAGPSSRPPTAAYWITFCAFPACFT